MSLSLLRRLVAETVTPELFAEAIVSGDDEIIRLARARLSPSALSDDRMKGLVMVDALALLREAYASREIATEDDLRRAGYEQPLIDRFATEAFHELKAEGKRAQAARSASAHEDRATKPRQIPHPPRPRPDDGDVEAAPRPAPRPSDSGARERMPIPLAL